MIKDFIRSKFSQKELLATKKLEATRINGILTNLESIINDLTISDIEYILEYKKFLENGTTIPKENSNFREENSNFREENSNFREEIVHETTFQDPVLFFEKSDTYKGRKLGWVFKTGNYGTGYYIDTKI